MASLALVTVASRLLVVLGAPGETEAALMTGSEFVAPPAAMVRIPDALVAIWPSGLVTG